MSAPIYLDNNATTPPLDSVVDEVSRCLRDGYGNASSPHVLGRHTRANLVSARERVAALLGAHPDHLVFTSGATEANNLAILQATRSNHPRRLITSAVEHSSVLRPVGALEEAGFDIVHLAVNEEGRVNTDALDAELRNGGAALVSVQWANSETGTLQDVDAIGAVCARYGVPLHVDAAQAIGRVPISFETSSIDYLSVTGHKVHGPQGTGALAVRRPLEAEALIRGGGQEHGLRSGTENISGIMGFAKAAEHRLNELAEAVRKMQALRDRFESAVKARVPETRVNGSLEHRVCNTANLRWDGVEGQALMANLEAEGVLCSQTSACTSGAPEPSHVLTGMGLGRDQAFASLRFSFSILNTVEEVDRAAAVLESIHSRLRAFASL